MEEQKMDNEITKYDLKYEDVTCTGVDWENLEFYLLFYYIIAKTTRFTSGCRRAVRFTVRPLSFAKPIER